MSPKQHASNAKVEDPFKDAAIHFGAHLQLKGLLRGDNQSYGCIKRTVLFDEFINHYQPEYCSQLVRKTLLAKLIKYHVLKSPQKDFSNLRIVKHPHPNEVRAPAKVTIARLYVHQSGVLRDRFVRSEVITEASCRLCNVSFFNEDSKQQHIESDIHNLRLLYRENRSSFKSSVEGARIGIIDADDESEVVLRCGESKTVTVKVTLDSSYTTANVYKIIELSEVKTDVTEFHNDMPIEVKVSAMFPEPGAYIFPLAAKIMPAKLCLLKDLTFWVESELMDQLAPVSQYVKRKDIIKEMEGAILPGEEVERGSSSLENLEKLRLHSVPVIYNKLVLMKLQPFENMKPHEEIILKRILELLCGKMSYRDAVKHIGQTKTPFIDTLNASSYSDRFALLLDLEELQLLHQIKNYDRCNETLQPCTTRFILKVPDLSEGRPSVARCDKVHVRLGGNKTVTYEGIIHEVQGDGLVLGFHKKFREEYTKLAVNGVTPKVDVRFTVNRFPILNMHRALKLVTKQNCFPILFPKQSEPDPAPAPNTSALRPWVNPLIEQNPEQKLAIKQIVNKTSGDAPYLVFGPPGTGKTVTIVEAIVQVWLTTEKSRAKQLVCAPSNAACNLITERLISSLPQAKILRLFSYSADLTEVSQSILSHSNYRSAAGWVTFPETKDILKHDIIVVTIITAGRLVTAGIDGKFQFVYIDECGQASEPESLVAIAGLITTYKRRISAQLVMAGDPEQLGPILSSQLAVDFGLGISMLERLMKHVDLYKKDPVSGYNNRYLTKLVQNYRSHPAILSIPNRLFYDNELEIKGNPDIINMAVGWEVLPNPQFPLIFHGIQGKDERESNSPSYFNRQEIDQVIIYLKKLFDYGLPNGYKVKNEDIGVITPYRKQVQKFRKAFDILGWEIKVGSVEEFQGSEKLIVFISTVRSSIALVDEDYRFNLGFLTNPKRFNVSVTRAKALLIMVGNPKILRHDKQWYQMLNYCRQKGALVGIPFPAEEPSPQLDAHIAC